MAALLSLRRLLGGALPGCWPCWEGWPGGIDHGGDIGAVIHDGQLVYPEHGSLFDTCDGSCDNGSATGSPLVLVEIAVNRANVFLTDDDYEFLHEGGIGEDDGTPDSASHLHF